MRLSTLKKLFTGGEKKFAGARRPLRFRPAFDQLEERRLLAVVWVDNNPLDTNPLDFDTIQAAVTAANPGDTIKVAPGEYDEAVSVPKSLTILGGQPRLPHESGASIVGVPDNSAGFDLLADTITINNFTIHPQAGATTGADGIVTHPTFSGEQILNDLITGNTIGLYLNSNGATQDVVHGNKFNSNNFAGAAQGNAIYSDQGLKNVLIDYNTFTGDLNASVILVGGNGSFGSLSTHSNIRILNNTMTNDGAIIAVNTVNSEIEDNHITNPSGSGIFFAGAVTNTDVEDNVLQGNPNTFTGINLRIDTANFNVARDLSNNPIPNSGDKITGNQVLGFGDSGIRLRDGTHNIVVRDNWLQGNGSGVDPTVGDGLSIEDSYSNTVTSNAVNKNRRDGIRLSNAPGNTLSNNDANHNGNASALTGDGIHLIGSPGNTISNNVVKFNVHDGVELESSNGNTINNNFTGSNGSDGIHLIDSSSNNVTNNTSNGSGKDGIHIVGTSSGNTIKKNTAKNNGVFDLHDETVGGGTAGTANTWSQNTANTRSPAGLL